jgi:hypothetical protein
VNGIRGLAAIGVLSIAFLLGTELAHAAPEPAPTPPDTAQSSTAQPSTGESTTAQSTTAHATPSPDPAASGATDGEGEGADLDTLLDTVIDASEGETQGDDGEGDSDDDAPLIEPGDGPGSSQQLADADAEATQADPGNDNVTVRIDDPGSSGHVSQGNHANAQANANANGPKPTAGEEGDSATDANASANQSNPNNTNVEVRIDSPGDIGPVDQSNEASAAAGAGGTGSAAGGNAGGNNANASATQTSPQNVNVVVRIDSPGDNGAVGQTNAATATAGAGPHGSAATAGDDPAGTFTTDQLVTTSGSSTVDNNGELVQSIDQDQGGNAPASAKPAGAAASQPGATTGSATATQADALNANVSVRIDSPGSDGDVNQSNAATRRGPDGKVVTVSGGSNIDIALSLTGSVGENAALENWVWNWVWDGGWTPPPGLAGATVVPTDGTLWNWLWRDLPATAPGSATSAAASAPAIAGPPPEQGYWLWTWTWVLADESTWSRTWRVACECSWVWNWTWDWSEELPSLALPLTAAPTGEAAPDADDASVAAEFDPATDGGPVTQTNTATATATATVELDAAALVVVTQTGSDPLLALQGAGSDQRLVNQQVAQAAAQADQLRPRNVSVTLGYPVESVTQANAVSAEAEAATLADVEQAVAQEQRGDDATEQWVEADQWAANAQVSIAVALTTQVDAQNVNVIWGGTADKARIAAVEQANEAETVAIALSEAVILQWIGQAQYAGVASVQLAVATQLHASLQTALAAAVVTQTRTANLNDVRVPKGSRATNPSVRQRNIVFTDSTSANWALIDAWILQTQEGAADIESSDAEQQGVVDQSADAYSPASQLDLLNRAGWLGIEPPDDAPGPTDGDEPPADGPAPVSPSTLVVPGPAGSVVAGPIEARTTTIEKQRISQEPTDRLGRLGGKLTVGLGGPGAAGRDPAPRPLRPPVSPRTDFGPGPGDASPAAGPGPSSGPAEGSARPHSSRPAGPSSGDDDTCAAALGTSGCAPLSGSSASAVATAPAYKLAAPAHLGLHVPGPILGRSVGLLEPFEWPG